METLNLPTETFCVIKLQSLFNNGMMRDHTDAIQYICEYFFETSTGMYYFYNAETELFEFRERADFNLAVKQKLDNHKDIESYFKKNSKIYQVVCKINNPRHYRIGNRYYLNECVGILHKSFKPFDEYENEFKQSVEMMKNYYKEVYCSNDEEVFNSLMKYFSQLVKGVKTEVIIYNKSAQGTGKSTGTSFMMDYVLGPNICLICNTEPLTTNYNKILLGKIWVIFEELPTFSTSQWAGVSSKLKTYTTEKMMMYRDPYEKSIQAENVFNCVINCNVESLKENNGRRVIIMPISNSKMNNHLFYSKLRKDCFNMKVGEAFYSYLMSIDTTNFYAQKDFPETEEKRVAIANLLCPTYLFLKSYVLRKEEIGRVKTKDFYETFKMFCENNKMKQSQKMEFFKKLDEIGLKQKKIGNNFYEITLKQLDEIADKGKWICDYDDFETDEQTDNENIVVRKEFYESNLKLLERYVKKYGDIDADINAEKEVPFPPKKKFKIIKRPEV